MRLKIPSKRNLLLPSLGGLALALALLFYLIATPVLTPKSLVHNTSVPPIRAAVAAPKSTQASVELPARLTIPEINVDAAIVGVGLTPDGAMDTTKSLDDVAWYDLGQRPGENGSAVITGHYGGSSVAAVFNALGELRKGDKLYTVDEKGTTTTFVVQTSRSYNPAADASAVFGSTDGKAHLNLITCEGVWSPITQSYPARLVVFTDKQ
jgi:LPXTG-site transpeptidase (sortase) family protein